MIDTSLPRKLERNISVQQIGSETLLYDEIRHQAFCLNPTSAVVWTLCDGAHTIAQIAEAASIQLQAAVSEQLVHAALVALRRDVLLEDDSPAILLPDASRRKLMRTLSTGAIAMLPLVAVVMAPTAAQAYLGCVDCTSFTSKQKRALVDAQKRAHEHEESPWERKLEQPASPPAQTP